MGYKCAKENMKKFLFMLVAFVAIFTRGTANQTSSKLNGKTEADIVMESSLQNIVVRQNAKLSCPKAKKELYLYKSGEFKLISGSEAIRGTYSIEDGENIVLNWGYCQSMYGKIYFKGAAVSRVVLGDETYF